ncbi:agmatine deiminase family protein [Marinilongibacter aquaticus]|uniref:agmatine deiminase family protein n=1 Tax=Marinilongibacter aquaticus TaxID=2975157 RepID=UPI0021BD3860|nr:agmatine deiminase family protein [Marinilongibacter aquaticus]UBM59770.1 agmatine deiminase family protein [Marinilongibacter aquaticus]
MNPKTEGYFFPAEWADHRATWLSFPHNLDTWEDRLPRIYPAYLQFIKSLSLHERVCIAVGNPQTRATIEDQLAKYDVDQSRVDLFDFPTNDSWCRDHGPSFVVNKNTGKKAIVNWGYNAWGGKYPPFDSDDALPKNVAEAFALPLFEPEIILEGGSVEFNGAGTLMTSKSCLLNPNRNPHLNQKEIEEKLRDFYNVEQVLWLEEGIVGDDTDGHVDDMTRFVNSDTVITAIESNRLDDNYAPLHENLSLLKKMQLTNGQKLNIVELPMPDPVMDHGLRLPASYANFYIANKQVIVPTYRCKKDDEALRIIGSCFPDREIIGIDSTEIIWGLGSFHCLSQQEPL